MKTVVLVIIDGFGVAPPGPGNAVAQAATPALQRLERDGITLLLQASGIGVGLPWGEPGNSEVGHTTIGAGRILYQYLPKIIFAIRDGSFFQNPALTGAVRHAQKNRSRLHIVGLLSSGGVHAYIDHFYALLELAQRENLSQDQVLVHMIADGRDALPQEAGMFLPQILERMNFLRTGRLASIVGRHYAMDRDGNWERTEQAYRLLRAGDGIKATDPTAAVAASYARGIYDEFLEPTVIINEATNLPLGKIESRDAVIFLNFREDSARQLAQVFCEKDFSRFPIAELQDLYVATMTRYAAGLNAQVAFTLETVQDSLGDVVAQHGLRQIRIGETEKYAHVTYFFNVGREAAFPQEVRRLIPSDPEPRFDLKPEMRAKEIGDEIVGAIERDLYSLIVANFANADMVGHTGNVPAIVGAVEIVDKVLARVLEAVLAKQDIVLIVTADHGNAEEKIDIRSGRPLTEHTTNPVPFFMIGSGIAAADRQNVGRLWEREADGFLADIAPTILQVLGLPVPPEMTGRSLL